MALEQEEYPKWYNGLVARYDKVKVDYEAISDKIQGNMAWQKELEQFIKILAEQEPVTEFDGALWASLADYMTVTSPDDIVVVFRDGTKIHENMETK